MPIQPTPFVLTRDDWEDCLIRAAAFADKVFDRAFYASRGVDGRVILDFVNSVESRSHMIKTLEILRTVPFEVVQKLIEYRAAVAKNQGHYFALTETLGCDKEVTAAFNAIFPPEFHVEMERVPEIPMVGQVEAVPEGGEIANPEGLAQANAARENRRAAERLVRLISERIGQRFIAQMDGETETPEQLADRIAERIFAAFA